MYLAEDRHFDKSVHLRRSVGVFASATFQETLISCLFVFQENKANMYISLLIMSDTDYLTAQTQIRLNRSDSGCKI